MGYVALNAKYYKDSKSKAELGHVERLFKQNKNAFDELTKNNFGSSESLYKDYLNKKNDALDDLRKRNKKAFQKNSNTFIDAVLIFDHEIFKKLINDNKQDEIKKTTNEFMLEFEKKFGFAPVGFEFHLDEGHEHEGEIKNNFHAHAIFLNYDFKKGIMPLRSMTKKNWEETQDLIYKHFRKFGFERGISKKLTQNNHKEKIDYLEDKVKVLEQREKDLLNIQNDYVKQIEEYQNSTDFQINNMLEIQDDVSKFVNNNMKTIQKIDNFLQRTMSKSEKSLGWYKAAKTKMIKIYDKLMLKEPIKLEQEITLAVDKYGGGDGTESRDFNNSEKVKIIKKNKTKFTP